MNTVTELKKQNKDLFPEKDIDLGKTKIIEMKIDSGDQLSINLRPYQIIASRENYLFNTKPYLLNDNSQ